MAGRTTETSLRPRVDRRIAAVCDKTTTSSTVGLLLATACCHHGEDRRPALAQASRCKLEVAIADLGVRDGDPRCAPDAGACGGDCAERTRACVLGAVGERRPVVAAWTGNYLDHVGHRHAVIARGDGDTYRIVWFDFRFASSDQASYVSIVARDCTGVVDIRDGCRPGVVCDPGRNERYEKLELGCVADGEPRTVCDDTWRR
jgi:hypothetical protein